MALPITFLPPRRRGVLIHAGLGLVLAAAVGGALFFAIRSGVGGPFVLLLMLAAIAGLALGLILYRLYALLNAGYLMERDGLRLRWGLRAEHLPIHDIEWVRPASDLAAPLPLPPLSFPGGILGMVTTEDLGEVEFLSSEKETMLLVATPHRIYAISPASPNVFLKAFRNTIEMGSLESIPSYSALPAAYLTRVWQDRLARILVGLGLVFTLLLFVAVSLAIPGTPQVSLGFDAAGQPIAPVPGEQLLLLPVLAGLAWLADVTGGLLLYRRPENRPAAYLLWSAGAVSSLTLILGAAYILNIL